MYFSPLAYTFDSDQQITETLTAFPGSSALVDDRSLLQIPLSLADGRPTFLRVTLPPKFPRAKPVLSLTTHVQQHAWVDNVCRLTPPSLQDWGSPGVRLLTVLQEAIIGISAAPSSGVAPAPRDSRQQRGPFHMKLPFFNQDRQSGAQQQQQPGAATAAAPAMRIPPTTDFPQLATMATRELEQALKDQVSYEKLLARVAAEARESDAGGGGCSSLAALRRETAELARANLAREAELAEIRNQIAIVKTSGYDAAKAEFEDKFARQEKAREQIAPERLIERLHEAAKAVDEESAALERRLRGGGLGEEGVRQYTAVRTRYHSLDLKFHAALQLIPTNTPVVPPPPRV